MTVRQIGNATLYHCDLAEVLSLLPRNAVVVSDPPYNIAYQHGGGGLGSHDIRNLKPIHGDEVPFDPTPWLAWPRVLLFGADHFRARLPEGGTFIAWDKSVGQGPADSFADAEFAWTNVKTKRNVIRHLWKGLCKASGPETTQPRFHPSQKPVAVMRTCIELLRPRPGQPVLDPFMGSGSTGVAAVTLGLPFVGVEIDAAYYATACDRISAAYLAGGGSPDEINDAAA